MKKIVLIIGLFLIGMFVFATEDTDEVVVFFNKYVKAANSYDKNYFSYYTPNPTIIRVVVKPNGQKFPVNVPFDRYKKETRSGMKLGKIVRYRNTYSNINVLKVDEDMYKLTALRHPSTGKKKFGAYFIIVKDPNGQYKIQEESMETPVQKFLEG